LVSPAVRITGEFTSCSIQLAVSPDHLWMDGYNTTFEGLNYFGWREHPLKKKVRIYHKDHYNSLLTV
jgi:hypothetical protein